MNHISSGNRHVKVFPFVNLFNFSPQPAKLSLTPHLQLHQASSPVEAAQDLASVLASRMDSSLTRPTRRNSTSATKDKPTYSTALPARCLMTAANAAPALSEMNESMSWVNNPITHQHKDLT